MRDITRDMLKVYKPLSGLDWMNYRVVQKDLTAHHIIKREDGGKLEWDNLALLMPIAHQYLHLIEFKDVETYTALNKIFQMINNQRGEPTRSQREFIEFLLKEFESEHKWDKGSKGKLVLKKKYLERGSF